VSQSLENIRGVERVQLCIKKKKQTAMRKKRVFRAEGRARLKGKKRSEKKTFGEGRGEEKSIKFASNIYA